MRESMFFKMKQPLECLCSFEKTKKRMGVSSRFSSRVMPLEENFCFCFFVFFFFFLIKTKQSKQVSSKVRMYSLKTMTLDH